MDINHRFGGEQVKKKRLKGVQSAVNVEHRLVISKRINVISDETNPIFLIFGINCILWKNYF